MAKYIVEAAVGGPFYGYETDPKTFYKSRKVELGKNYVVVGFVKSKSAALKIAYRYAKQTPQKSVFIKSDLGKDYMYNWGEVLWTDNPKAWYYNKTIVHSMDDPANWRQLKYDGSIGKIIRRY